MVFQLTVRTIRRTNKETKNGLEEYGKECLGNSTLYNMRKVVVPGLTNKTIGKKKQQELKAPQEFSRT